jgi:hypothetical protein
VKKTGMNNNTITKGIRIDIVRRPSISDFFVYLEWYLITACCVPKEIKG